jgi:hypothetical protein
VSSGYHTHISNLFFFLRRAPKAENRDLMIASEASQRASMQSSGMTTTVQFMYVESNE